MNSIKQFEKNLNRKLPDNYYQSYICLEQPETLDLLNFLSICPNNNLPINNQLPKNCQTIGGTKQCKNKRQKNIIFNSDTSEQISGNLNKREKNFHFDGIFNHEQKNRHYFRNQIQQICEMALIGYNQNVFIYGTEEAPKQKLLIGQSQNPGIFLSVLAYIFEYCHQKCLQDYITVKLSAPVHRNGKFHDIFSGNQIAQLKRDQIQGLVIQTCPQIIIRNVKTGLKILNMILKSNKDSRDTELTQNLILSLKIQIDWESQKLDKQKETTVYCMSKINFIKLANPSINSSLRGVNKSNIWFVNLFNLLRSSNNYIQSKKQDEQLDEFTLYIKQAILDNSSKIYCLTSITNKMSSNQCLTALLFSHYLKFANSSPKKSRNLINLTQFARNMSNLPNHVINFCKENQSKSIMCNLLHKIYRFQEIKNYLEYQYSLVIGQACQRLNKYIFTEQLQDFFYAKKINLQKSSDLTEIYKETLRMSSQITYLKKKLQKKYRNSYQKPQNQSHEDLTFFINQLNTMSQHFLLEETHLKSISQQTQIILSFLTKISPINQSQSNNQIIKSQITQNETNTNPFESYQPKDSINQPNLTVQKVNINQKKLSQIHINGNVNNLKPITQCQQLSTVRQQIQQNRQNLVEIIKKNKIEQINVSSQQGQPKNNGLNSQQNQKTKYKSKPINKAQHHSEYISYRMKNRSPTKDNLTMMFTNKNIEYKTKLNYL